MGRVVPTSISLRRARAGRTLAVAEPQAVWQRHREPTFLRTWPIDGAEDSSWGRRSADLTPGALDVAERQDDDRRASGFGHRHGQFEPPGRWSRCRSPPRRSSRGEGVRSVSGSGHGSWGRHQALDVRAPPARRLVAGTAMAIGTMRTAERKKPAGRTGTASGASSRCCGETRVRRVGELGLRRGPRTGCSRGSASWTALGMLG